VFKSVFCRHVMVHQCAHLIVIGTSLNRSSGLFSTGMRLIWACKNAIHDQQVGTESKKHAGSDLHACDDGSCSSSVLTSYNCHFCGVLLTLSVYKP
jgi:hypothetical protein